MTGYFQNEIQKIKNKIISLGSRVEEMIYRAVHVIETLDGEEANKIIGMDKAVDRMEIEIEEDCLKLLALYQPVAADLRFLVAVIKINNDLERVADEAVNIANRINSVADTTGGYFDYNYSFMAEKAKEMLKLSLDTLVNPDTDLAYKIRIMDDEVDRLKSEVYDSVKRSIKDKPKHAGHLINMFMISRHLERIADHATNIAEEVIYILEGNIVRHDKI